MKNTFVRIALVFVAGAVAATLLIMTVNHVRKSIELSYFRAEAADLWSAYPLWIQAGRPLGTSLVAFAERFKGELSPTDKRITAPGMDYITILCNTNLLYREGSLFLSTNGVVLWVNNAVVLAKESPAEQPITESKIPSK